jgi:hypothetical protein
MPPPPPPKPSQTMPSLKVSVQLASMLELLRRAGEKCAGGCPACREITGTPERGGLPAVPPTRQPRQHEDPDVHRRNCPGVEVWSLHAQLTAATEISP